MTTGKSVYATTRPWQFSFSTEFCPLCDKQVIASALGQLRINFTRTFKVFQIALVAPRLGQFCENFENTREISCVKLIFNYARAHAITYTKYNFCLRNKYNVFYRRICWLRICLFRYVFCRHLAKLVILVQFWHCRSYQWSPCSYFHCRQLDDFRCVCLSHRGCLIWVKFVKIRKQKFKSQHTVINPCSVLW